jgi:hypothetical protein
MDWARILAFVTGMVDQELLARNEYLAAEAQLKGRLKLSDAERATLGEIGHRLGRQVLGEVANVARPETILAWYRKLVARKFDGSKARRVAPDARLISLCRPQPRRYRLRIRRCPEQFQSGRVRRRRRRADRRAPASADARSSLFRGPPTSGGLAASSPDLRMCRASVLPTAPEAPRIAIRTGIGIPVGRKNSIRGASL